jgi:hypothetical protein
MSIAPRFATTEIAKIQVYGRPGDIIARLKNISATGACFELTKGTQMPNQGDFIHVIVHLNALNKTHQISGQVVWNKGPSFGISFMKKDHIADAILKGL